MIDMTAFNLNSFLESKKNRPFNKIWILVSLPPIFDILLSKYDKSIGCTCITKHESFPGAKSLTQEFTSKTCGNCGNIDSTLGGKKDYKCLNCDFEADRDHNGARNILIRYMSKKSVFVLLSVGACEYL
jgi:hypothetical protein